MPRCNLTLKQKCQIIELYGDLSTEQLAKKFHVHQSTITRTLQKKQKLFKQASRINSNFKTVQTAPNSEEHDLMILEYIRSRQKLNQPTTINDICDKAEEYSKILNKKLKSKRGWWRRFKFRCNIVRTKISVGSPSISNESVKKDQNSKPITKSKKTSYTFRIKDTTIVKTKNQDFIEGT